MPVRPMERIATGYALAEAPLAAPDGGLYFSDALAGGVYRWSPGSGSVETVLEKRRGIGGMAAHAAGGLVVSGRDLARVDGGVAEVLYAWTGDGFLATGEGIAISSADGLTWQPEPDPSRRSIRALLPYRGQVFGVGDGNTRITLPR